MIVYLDTSAMLRLLLHERGALPEVLSSDGLVASELLAVEAMRTIDRLRQQGVLTHEAAAMRRVAAEEWLEAVDLVLVRRPILSRSSEPMATPLGTLDALHLATALTWQERFQRPLVMATHDEGLALAARSHGMAVMGA